jgi:hypothetical protein
MGKQSDKKYTSRIKSFDIRDCGHKSSVKRRCRRALRHMKEKGE